MRYTDFMALQNNNIPKEVSRLRLCSALQNCGHSVEMCLKKSKASKIVVFDDDTLGYTDWRIRGKNRPDAFTIHNKFKKTIVLLPLDHRIISGPNIIVGGVADCAILTTSNLDFIEFKTNVIGNSVENLDTRTEKAMKQLWRTYDGIFKPRCLQNSIDIPALVKIEFYIVFNKELDVTGAMASRQNYQEEFRERYGYRLFFENEKEY